MVSFHFRPVQALFDNMYDNHRVACDIALQACVKYMSDEPSHYHTFRHVDEMIDLLNEMISKGEINMDSSAYAILLCSIYFHDIVFVPGNKDNELKSADLARHFLSPLLTKREVETIRTLIISTKVVTKVEHLKSLPMAELLHDLDYMAFGYKSFDMLMRNDILIFLEAKDIITREQYLQNQIAFVKTLPSPLFLTKVADDRGMNKRAVEYIPKYIKVMEEEYEKVKEFPHTCEKDTEHKDEGQPSSEEGLKTEIL